MIEKFSSLERVTTEKDALKDTCKKSLGGSALPPNLSSQTIEAPILQKRITGCGGECPECPDGVGGSTATSSECQYFQIGPSGKPICEKEDTFTKQMERAIGGNGGVSFPDSRD